MAAYYTTRYRYTRDPKTGKMKATPYRQLVSQAGSVFEAIETASPEQTEALQNIVKAKEAGADPRQFRTSLDQMGTTAEQAALVGTIDVNRGQVTFLNKDLQERLRTEAAIQPELRQVRERRAQAAKEQAKVLSRQTGRRALLASPGGGRGFFGGYFKG